MHPQPLRIAARRDDDMRTLIDLAIERIHLAGMGDIEWKDALAAVTRALHTDRAILFTPELTPDAGGLSAVHDRSAAGGPRELRFEPHGSDEIHSTLLSDGGERTMPSTLFVVLRVKGATGFSVEERHAFDLLARHASMAVRLWFRRHASKHGAEELASSLNAAALIVDPEGHVLWMNRRANAWAQAGRLVVTRGRLGRIDATRLDLSNAIRETLERRMTSEVRVDGDLTIEIAPVPMPRVDSAGSGKAALVLLRDRTGCRQVAGFLAQRYRLTSAEVDLALALWNGLLVAEYASRRNVAMSTVRTQLKALLAKTGARRQSDVVALVARMLPVLGNPSLAALTLMAEVHQESRDTPARRDTSNG
jgi:DNA-binding CsgD family transcriptional regulator